MFHNPLNREGSYQGETKRIPYLPQVAHDRKKKIWGYNYIAWRLLLKTQIIYLKKIHIEIGAWCKKKKRDNNTIEL